MNHPQLKVTYFPIAGRAEITRLALAYGNIPFDDERVTGEQFGAMKPTLPLGQLPVLHVGGKIYSQSVAMARYAGKLSGLYPSDPLEALRVDMVIDTLVDILNIIVDIKYKEQDEAKKAEKTKKLTDETLPQTLKALEKMVDGKFFLGDKITLADVYVFNQVEDGIKASFPDFNFSAYPKIEAIVNGVKAHPNIAAYRAKH